jgi:trk system potassium uptake protein TrkH
VLTFLAIIFAGAFLLLLPIAHNGQLSFIDAIFTSTSATCVTGLIVKDTPNDYTFFGQFIIMLLIQVGGIGYLTLATFTALVFGRKLSHRDQMVLKTSMGYDSMTGLIRFLKRTFAIIFTVEVLAGLLLSVRFSQDMSFSKAMWAGYFHAVSAFNNAGFSVFQDNLMSYKFDIITNIIVTCLIIMGGIGYFVIIELYHYQKGRLTRISTHTKLTLTTTIFLIISGFLLFLTLEWNNPGSIGKFSTFQKIITSYFYAINLRTAGFNSLDLSSISDSMLFLSTIYMVIGGGVGGTAGGVKVTVFALVALSMWHVLKGHSEVSIFKRTIPHKVVTQATVTLFVATFYIILSTILLAETQKASFLKILYEVASAFGTVGISTGNGGVLSLAANFNNFGKVNIIFLMIAGRIGILAFTLALVGKIEEQRYKHAEGRVMI